jgi:hypothetical protein
VSFIYCICDFFIIYVFIYILLYAGMFLKLYTYKEQKWKTYVQGCKAFFFLLILLHLTSLSIMALLGWGCFYHAGNGKPHVDNPIHVLPRFLLLLVDYS